MWSGPRNLSTALMYSFASRDDCAAWDEPFYAAYLSASGIDHPMKNEVMAAGETDPERVGARCVGPTPNGKSVFYQKHMTLHMLPQFDRSFMRHCTNVFLIRHPARVVDSYARKRESVTLADIGAVQQAQLFDEVASWLGCAPPVVDSADIRADPAGTLARLCDAIELPYTDAMLRWPAGGNAADGVWAPHWYAAVHASTGFDGAEGTLPTLTGQPAAVVEEALPHYERLREFAL